MVYPILKIVVRLALKIFCAELIVHNHRALHSKGSLLITANHPNSFLDAIIIGALFSRPIHFLARGDAFKKPWHNALLKTLNMIPIYRLSEGKENLHLNEKTFLRSQEILAQGGIVLIFIEGLCVHEYGLRSFKKGAARIALNCFHAAIPLRVLPLGINYSDFRKMGVWVEVHPGKLLYPEEIFKEKDIASNLLAFNNSVLAELEPLVWKENKLRHPGKNYWIVLPAFLGRFIHAPYYYPLRNFVSGKTKNTVFYHAVLFGVLLFTYPLFIVLISVLLMAAGVNALLALSVFVVLPFLGWSAVQQKRNNY